MSSIRETFLERERDDARRALTYAHTAIRNALTELADGDEEAAIETLRQIVGDDTSGVMDSGEADARRGRYVVQNAEWRRNEGRTYLMVRVPGGSDLSCVATRERALDAVIAGVLGTSNDQPREPT